MASNSGAIRAGRAYVEAFLDDNQLVRGLKGAERKLKAWGGSLRSLGGKLGGAGASIVAPLLTTSKVFADVGSKLVDASDRTGVGVESLSELGFAAEQSGADLETLEVGLRKMQKGLVSAAMGSTEAQVTFLSLGLSLRKLMQASPEAQFQAIAEAISRIPDPTARAAAAMQVFGKSGTMLLPLLQEGAGGIAELRQRARALGLVMSEEDARAAAKWDDTLVILGKSLRSVVTTIGAAVTPTLTRAADWIVRIAGATRDFIDRNRTLVDVLLKVGAGLAVAGAGFTVLGVVLPGVGMALGGIAEGISLIGASIAFLTSPIGLVVAGLTALTAWFLTSTKAGGQALQWLGRQFEDLKEVATLAFRGISDALSAGDIKLAGQILWAALRVEFIKGTNFLKAIWADWGVAAVEVWRGAVFSIARLLVDLWAGARIAFTNGIGFIQDSWTTGIGTLRDGFTSFIAFIKTQWNNFGGFFAKVWERIKALFSGDDPSEAIGKIDAETAAKNATANQDAADAMAARHAGENATIGQREAARRAALGQINAEAIGSKDALDARQRGETDARREAAREGLARDARALADAEAELKRLTDQAANERAGEGPGAPKRPGPPEDFGPDALDSALGQAQRKLESKGTFSGAALAGLGAGDSLAERQVSEQKKTNQELSKLNDKARVGRLVFGA